jgi:hypothetical protein
VLAAAAAAVLAVLAAVITAGAAAVARLAADRAAISKGTYSQGQTTIGQEFMNIYKNNCRMICKPFKNFKTKSVWLNMS